MWKDYRNGQYTFLLVFKLCNNLKIYNSGFTRYTLLYHVYLQNIIFDLNQHIFNSVKLTYCEVLWATGKNCIIVKFVKCN